MIVPVAALAWLLAAPATFVHRIDRILAGEHTSLMIRIVGYTQALQILRDNPVFGVGWGNVGEERTHGFGGEPRAAENYFLQNGMALGGVGLIGVIVVCFLYFRYALTRPPPGWPAREEWPRAALLVAGAAFYVQVQAQPAADPVSGYILWTLLPIAERMRMAYRGES